jgi:hypothetical protein
VSLRNVSASGHSNDSNSEIHEGYKEDDSVSVHSSDSEATLPDLLPVSSSSALSHYTDAFEGSDTGADADAATSTAEDGDVWATPMQTPMESTPPNIFAPSPASPAVPDPQVTPQPPRASALPPSTPEGPANAIPGAYGPGPAPTLTVSEGDHEEMLTMTPRGGRDRSATSSDSGTIEPETCAPRRSFSPASVSSGSDVSVRQSFEDNFRGLFYRAPDMPSPEHRSRKLPAPRSLLAAAQRSQRTSRAGAGSGSGTGSPRSSARASPEPQNIVGLGISLNDERDRDDRLPLTSAPRTVPRATERPIGSGASSPLAKASSRPSSRTATRSTDRSPRQSSTSLGIMGMTPVSAGASLARGAGVLDSDNIPMSSTPPRTPPPTIDTPADDSWITKCESELCMHTASLDACMHTCVE